MGATAASEVEWLGRSWKADRICDGDTGICRVGPPGARAAGGRAGQVAVGRGRTHRRRWNRREAAAEMGKEQQAAVMRPRWMLMEEEAGPGL